MLANAPHFPDYIGETAREHFGQVTRLLDHLGIAWTLNPGLVRGLDYYCRTVFEWTTDALGAQGTVCAGGRYDDLVEIQGGKSTPGIGFALGMERLIELLRQTGREFADLPDVYLLGAEPVAARLALAESLRDRQPGLRPVVDLQGGSFKAQFKRADRSGAALAIVLGEQEITDGTVVVKEMLADRSQQTVAQQDLADWLAKRFDLARRAGLN
ncbi:MAG: histidine--tRNA ligase [Xanthomonadaceae bacterium]|nr:histidine--tRNA ligase [Xanthomonadaceae bacterium]